MRKLSTAFYRSESTQERTNMEGVQTSLKRDSLAHRMEEVHCIAQTRVGLYSLGMQEATIWSAGGDRGSVTGGMGVAEESGDLDGSPPDHRQAVWEPAGSQSASVGRRLWRCWLPCWEGYRKFTICISLCLFEIIFPFHLVSFSVGLLVTDSLRFCLEITVWSSSLKNMFARYRFLCWQIF